MPGPPRPASGTPEAILQVFFRQGYPEIYRKVQLQVRRTPRRQTGPYRTNRESRWTLDPDHPDYTAAEQIPLTEAKLFAMSLEFDAAPIVPPEVLLAASAVLGHDAQAGSYRCPVSGRVMDFNVLLTEARNPRTGRSSFHVGHVRPRAQGGANTPDNTYWTSDLGNRIQGDKTWAETVKIIVEMAEFQRAKANISWGELVNRYRD